MEVVNNSALRITVPDHIASAITNSIEKSKILNTRGNLIDLLVYWGIEEMSQLNKLVKFKSNLPSPMVRDYNWPGLYKPFDHQKTTSEFLSIKLFIIFITYFNSFS